MKQQLIRFATTNSLTGLLNRRAFFDSAEEMCVAAVGGQPLSAIVFDVDHFKTINDTYGHGMGDRVLAAIGEHTRDDRWHRRKARRRGVLRAGLRRTGRRDGLVRRVAARHPHATIPARRRPSFGITCSFGVTEWEDDNSIDRTLRRADMAMYEAKRSGRDRIVAADTFALTKSHDQWQGAARLDGRQR